MHVFKCVALVFVAFAVYMDASPTRRKRLVTKEEIEAKLFERIATTWLKHGQPIQTAANNHVISSHTGTKKFKRHSSLGHLHHHHHHHFHNSRPTYHQDSLSPKIYTPPARPFVITSPATPSQDEHTSRRGEFLLEMAYDRFFGEEYQNTSKDRKDTVVRKEAASGRRKDRQRIVLIGLPHRYIHFQTRLGNLTAAHHHHLTNLPPRKVLPQQKVVHRTPSSVADKSPVFSVLKGTLPEMFLTTERSETVGDYAVHEITERVNVDDSRQLPEELQELAPKTTTTLQATSSTTSTSIHFPISTDHPDMTTEQEAIVMKEYTTEAYAKVIDEIHQIVLAGVGNANDAKHTNHTIYGEKKEDETGTDDQIGERIFDEQAVENDRKNEVPTIPTQEVTEVIQTEATPDPRSQNSSEKLRSGDIDEFNASPAVRRTEEFPQTTGEPFRTHTPNLLEMTTLQYQNVEEKGVDESNTAAHPGETEELQINTGGYNETSPPAGWGRDFFGDPSQSPSADLTTTEAELATEIISATESVQEISGQSEILSGRDIFYGTNVHDPNDSEPIDLTISATQVYQDAPATEIIGRDDFTPSSSESDLEQTAAFTEQPAMEFETTEDSTQILSDFGRDNLFDAPVSHPIASLETNIGEQTTFRTAEILSGRKTEETTLEVTKETDANSDEIASASNLTEAPGTTGTRYTNIDSKLLATESVHPITSAPSDQFFRGLFEDDLNQSANETDSTEISVLGLPLSAHQEASQTTDTPNESIHSPPLALTHDPISVTDDQDFATAAASADLTTRTADTDLTDSPFRSLTEQPEINTEHFMMETTVQPDFDRNLLDEALEETELAMEESTQNYEPTEMSKSVTEVNSDTTISDSENMQIDDSFMAKEAGKGMQASTFQEDANVDAMVLESYVPVLKKIVSQTEERQTNDLEKQLETENGSEGGIANSIQVANPQPLPLADTGAVESETGDINETTKEYTENPQDHEQTPIPASENDDRVARLIPPWLLQNQKHQNYQNLETATEKRQTEKQQTEKPLDETGMELMVVDGGPKHESKVDALMPLIPVIVEDLRKGVVTKEERQVLEEVFGSRWTDIMDMAKKTPSELDLAMEEEEQPVRNIRTHRGNRTSDTSRRQGRDLNYSERLSDYLHEDDYYEEDGQDEEAPDIGELKGVAEAHINWRHHTIPRGSKR